MTIPDSVRQPADSLTTPTGYFVINDRMVVWIDGDDAQTWLNGQLTNDVRTITPEVGVYALILTTKGRVLADVHVFQAATSNGPRIGMAVPTAAWAELSAHLEKYIIMEDVTLVEDQTAILVHALGSRAEELASGFACRWSSGRLGAPGFDVLLNAGERENGVLMKTLVARASELGASLLSHDQQEALRIAHGTPRFGVDFGHTTYPQEAGLKSAISFQKGCYLGQEVVCMLENRGQLSRFLVVVESDQDLVAKRPIVNEEHAEVGELTSVSNEGGHHRAIAIVKRTHATVGAALFEGDLTLTIREVVGAP